MDLSLVLACYNEKPVLEDSVREILKVLNFTRMTYEIIFVDDASRDGTQDIIRAIMARSPTGRMKAVFHEHNTGRGRAVSDGITQAEGEVVGFIDVDLEVHARYIPACCLAVMDGAQVVLGARVYKFVLRGLWRRFLSAGYAALAHALLPVGSIRDTESGLKFFNRKAVLPILGQVRDSGWFWDTEVMVRCHLAGLSINEIPCMYIRHPFKKSSVRIMRDILESLSKLFRFRGELARAGLLRGRNVPPCP